MPIVECPSCNQDVDLGHIDLQGNGTEIYECPHCSAHFEWTSQDELERLEDLARAKKSEHKATNHLQRAEHHYKFPMLVGNFRARWWFPTSVTEVILLMCYIPLLPLLPLILISGFFIDEFKRIRYRREFNEDILNPAYLRGTGLVIFSDLSAELIAKRRVPKYMFEKEDLTGIVLHTESYSVGESEYELKIHLHGFHALTLYGFNQNDSKKIVNKLMSLYDIELRYTEHYNIPDISGGGGGGG